MADDTKIGKALDLAEPPESPRFFYELQARISEHDRKALLRWRRGSAVVISVAAAAVAAVAVLAATNGAASNKVLDRTFSCRAGTDPRGLAQIGVNGSVALGESTGASSGAGWTELSTPAAAGAPKPWIDFLNLAGDKSGAIVGSSLCHPLRTPLGLKAPRLPQTQSSPRRISAGSIGHVRCRRGSFSAPGFSSIARESRAGRRWPCATRRRGSQLARWRT